MDDSILDSTELNENADADDEIAFVKGDTIYKKIIPILLSPKVIFPFGITQPIVTDPHLKQLFEQAFEEKTIVGYAYHSEDSPEKLPPLQHVGVAAIIPELSKLVDGSYLVKIVPLSRFFITDYINADPKDLTAQVSYYWDQREDDKLVRHLALEYIKIKKQIDETIKDFTAPKKKSDELDLSDHPLLSALAYAYFATHPNLTEDEKQYLLWMYKVSDRLAFLIALLIEALPAAKRAAARTRPFKNN